MKLFEYLNLKSYVISDGIGFLQQTHSSNSDDKKLEDELNGNLLSLSRKIKFMRSYNWLLRNQEVKSN